MLVAGLRESRGESIAGYKIGCVSEAVQKQLGIGEPVFGHLFASEAHRSGITLHAENFDGLAVEGEFAFRLAEDFTDAGSIGAAFAVIELHNYVFRGPNDRRVTELIANNAMHAGVVLPSDDPHRNQDLLHETISVIRNGSVLGSASSCALPGGPLASVAWLAARLKDLGRNLRRGHIVLTGSPLPLYPIAPGDSVEVTCGRLPAVIMTLSPGNRKATHLR
jgi:2-keto-4-pentenoate hydratase